MKYRIATNTYPYVVIIAEGFASERDAIRYAWQMMPIWVFGEHMWHVEAYKAE